MNCYVPTKPEFPVMVGSSRRKTSSHWKRTTHHNKTVPRRRTRKRSHQRNKEKKVVQQPMIDFATRHVLHDKTDSERTRHQSHHSEGESSRGTSYNSVSLSDFPEIKWVDDDENDHDHDCFHFRRGGYKGSPDDIFVDHLVHQEDQSRVLQSALTLRRQRRSLQRCLLRSKTIRRDLAGTISSNHESCSTRELLDSLVVVPSKEMKSLPAAIPNETWLLETQHHLLCYKQQQHYRDSDLTASVPALKF